MWARVRLFEDAAIDGIDLRRIVEPRVVVDLVGVMIHLNATFPA
jgi:hypothetical protein